MSPHTPHRSRAFFVTSTIALSVAFFAVAVGAWLISQGRLDSSADTIGSCTPATQTTQVLNPQGTVDFSAIPLPSGWVADPGTVVRGVSQHNSLPDLGPRMAVYGRIQRPIREGLSGEVTVLPILNTRVPENESPTISLLTRSGPPITLRFTPANGGYNSAIQYRDPLTTEWRAVTTTLPELPGWPQAVHPPNNGPITIAWKNGATFTVQGVDPLFGRAVTSNEYRFNENEPTSVTKLVLAGSTVNSLFGDASQPLEVKSVIYPDGSAVPCVTGISPATAVAGTEVIVTGSQFEATGMKVTLKPTIGDTVTLETVSRTDDTHLRFTVPTTTAAGSYEVGVTNSAGASTQKQRLTVTAPPAPPAPTVTVSPLSGPAPLAITASVNFPVLTPPSPTTNLLWNFGDGQTVTNTERTMSHTYANAGTYDLTVTTEGQTLRQSITVTAPVVVVPPSLTGIAPSSGVAGSQVALTGTGFTATGNTISLTGPGAAQTTTSIENLIATGTALIFTVPSNAVLGTYTVKVINANGTSATGQPLTVISGVPAPVPTTPTLTGIAPNAGPSGTSVGLAGTNFTATGNTVELTNATGTVTKVENVSPTSVSSNLLIFTVPSGLAVGPYSVRLSNSTGISVAPQTFTVTAGTPAPVTAPTLTGIAPASGAAGIQVLLSGSNFKETGNTVELTNATGTTTKVENVSAAAGSTTLLTFTVPSNAAVGAYAVKVTNTNGTTSTGQVFTVTASVLVPTQNTPTLTGIAPTTGIATTQVALAGTNFTATGNTVELTNPTGTVTKVENVSPAKDSTTLLLFTVPTGTPVALYSVRVRNSNGVTVTPQSFTVTATPVVPVPVITPTPQGGGTTNTAPASATSTAAATAPASLVSTGGSLTVNLGIAFLLSIVTGYFLLRRRHPGRQP